jgi:RNA polymerase sigma factor (sigma-70 family)
MSPASAALHRHDHRIAGMTAGVILREPPAAGCLEPATVAARALTIARRTALGVLGDREAAADVAQDVAIAAVRHARRIRDPMALDGWLHRIAVRAALKEKRRGRRRRAAELAHHEARRPAMVEHRLDGALAVLDLLPARQRAALTLRYVHDLPDADIARAMGCRPGTVRSLLCRGRDAMRLHLQEERAHDPERD